MKTLAPKSFAIIDTGRLEATVLFPATVASRAHQSKPQGRCDCYIMAQLEFEFNGNGKG